MWQGNFEARLQFLVQQDFVHFKGKWRGNFEARLQFLVQQDFVHFKGKWKMFEAEKDVNLNQTQLKMLGLSG
jgi:hypothetical protein